MANMIADFFDMDKIFFLKPLNQTQTQSLYKIQNSTWDLTMETQLLATHPGERSSLYLKPYINLASYGSNPQLRISEKARAQWGALRAQLSERMKDGSCCDCC